MKWSTIHPLSLHFSKKTPKKNVKEVCKINDSEGTSENDKIEL